MATNHDNEHATGLLPLPVVVGVVEIDAEHPWDVPISLPGDVTLRVRLTAGDPSRTTPTLARVAKLEGGRVEIVGEDERDVTLALRFVREEQARYAASRTGDGAIGETWPPPPHRDVSVWTDRANIVHKLTCAGSRSGKCTDGCATDPLRAA